MDGSERDDDDEWQQINFYELHGTKGAAIEAYNFYFLFFITSTLLSSSLLGFSVAR